jgi:hypothetical protein
MNRSSPLLSESPGLLGTASVPQTPGQRWRLPGLCLLLLLALGGNSVLARLTPSAAASQSGFVTLWLLTYLPYLAVCALILWTPAPRGRGQRLELALLFAGALALRLPFLLNAPNLSRDAWRYVWDARVFLHGYSPYVYAPGNTILASLRDFIYTNSRFRNVPSIYPPGAEYVYILSYLLVPSNLFFLKGVFLVFDLTGCALLALLLARKGLDPARAALYAWCPLPIVEFALEGHVDVITITCTLLAFLAAQSTTTRGRALTGFLIGVATLTKLYPILLLAPLVRLRDWRREWVLALTCLLTVALGYLPFYLLGHGEITGYFFTYASEQGQNAGLVQQLVLLSGWIRQLPLTTTIAQEHLVALVLLVSLALTVCVLRQQERLSAEAGVLVLFGLILAVSSHVFPWYTTTLLPWIILLLPAHIGDLPAEQRLPRLLALGALWMFACISIVSYYMDWIFYYIAVDGLLGLELFLAAVLSPSLRLLWFWKKETVHER